ncbi:MAG: hypothetical protein IJM17_01270 [Firmicutes bacterium]|nr:hypothetical protein [Bacillota bacterium]
MLKFIKNKQFYIIAFVIMLAFVLIFSSACGKSKEAPAAGSPSAEQGPKAVKSEGVMTHDEYRAAEIGDEVVIETYVQAAQAWWNDSIVLYTCDEDGAYFIYNLACTEEEAEKLVPGQKIKVTGTKAEWFGEIEVADATFEFEEGSYIAEPIDATDILGTAFLEPYRDSFVTIKGLTVEAMDESGAAFYYGWDNSQSPGTDSDLYFKVSKGGQEYVFVVEYYLCNEESEVYKAVRKLEVGQTIDAECFLYWYNGVQPHVTSIKVSD